MKHCLNKRDNYHAPQDYVEESFKEELPSRHKDSQVKLPSTTNEGRRPLIEKLRLELLDARMQVEIISLAYNKELQNLLDRSE